ncbi:MAG: hypothetical protein C3F10_10380 [Dehalococcoidia bacterium]|nr:MAG: hypothetical protein C3F10_10380 [Dehalococcoidia bacterium]
MDMTTLFRRSAALMAFATLSAIAIFALGACGDDADTGASPSGDALVLTAINVLDNAGFHEIDDAIQQEKKIPATARTTTIRMQALVQLTAWPNDDLEAQADALATLFGEFAEVLDAESPDMTRVSEASTKVHIAQHDFSGAVWEHLYEAAGLGKDDGHTH